MLCPGQVGSLFVLQAFIYRQLAFTALRIGGSDSMIFYATLTTWFVFLVLSSADSIPHHGTEIQDALYCALVEVLLGAEGGVWIV